MKVNRLKDWMERTGWTLAEFAISLPIGAVLADDPLSWWTPLIMGAVTTLKIVVAQHFGKYDDGAAIPGGVIEP